MERILVIGACGQIGTELTPILRARYGYEDVLAVDIQRPNAAIAEGLFERLDVLDAARLHTLIKKYEIRIIYQLAAFLSAKGEYNPSRTWALNANGMLEVLEVARSAAVAQVFFPSSVAVFGPNASKQHTPQQCYRDPTTMYGITKVAGEQLCSYYRAKYNMDIRSLRYPGLISAKQSPGGGITDYAVQIFTDCIQKGSYDCYIEADTQLPMMYIEDAIAGTLQLMDAEARLISVTDSYNFTAMSFSPAELAAAIQAHYPQFKIRYAPDYRQHIANSWPRSIDDSIARRDWNWKPTYDLTRLVDVMCTQLKDQVSA